MLHPFRIVSKGIAKQMRTQLLLRFPTTVGSFYIGQSADRRFHPIYNDQSLGSYDQLYHAAEDLAVNATFTVYHASTGTVLDTSRLGIPEDPAEWQRIMPQ